MFLTKKTLIILFLICLIVFFYIKSSKTEKYINVTDISNVILRLYNKQKRDDFFKKISQDIDSKVITSEICLGKDQCFSDIKDEVDYYDEISNTYFFNKLKNKDVNTKKLCIRGSCISEQEINSFKQNAFLSRLNNYNIFNSYESVIYPDMDNFDLSGNLNSLINVSTGLKAYGQLASSNVKSNRNTIYTCFNNTGVTYNPAVSNCTNTYKVPFNDSRSKFALKLDVQNAITPDTSGIHINMNLIKDQYDISFNTLWLNIPNYVYSTFKVNLIQINTNPPNIIVKHDFGSFGGGLRLKNNFNDKLNLYDGSGSFFEWVPIPLSSYPNIYDSSNNRICIGLDRAQMATSNDTNLRGFKITGIGFSTNPYNFCRISPSVLFYNESNQRIKNFLNQSMGFKSQLVELENLKDASGTEAPSLNVNSNVIPYLALKTVSDISGLIIKEALVKFSIHILPPLQNKRKIIYIIGARETDIKSISQIRLAVTPIGEINLNLTPISNYPPYSLTSVPNIICAIVDNPIILSNYFFALTIVSSATSAVPINIIEIGSFDIDK